MKIKMYFFSIHFNFPGKTSGPDQINNRILKDLAHPLSLPLCDLFNYSLSCGKIPKICKQANVTPFFKKGDQSEVSNYKPISLSCTIGKVMEKLLHKYSTALTEITEHCRACFRLFRTLLNKQNHISR